MNTDRYELILNVTTEGFWDWDLKKDRAYLSPRYCELVGYSPDDTIFDSHFLKTILHPDDCENVFTIIGECLQGKRDIFVIDYRMISKDGTIRWIECRGKIVEYDDQCAPVRMVGTIVDISKRKQVEESLKEREFFFKESQRSASIGSYKTDFIAGYWESSEVLDEIFGIDRNYNRSVQGWLDIVHPDDRDLMGQYLREEVIAKRKPFSKEYRIVRKNDGQTRWVNGLGEVKFDDSGNIVSMYGTIQDITERKLAEKSLRESETRFSTVYHSSPVGIGISRLADGKFLDVNDAFLAIYGIAREEVLGHTAIELGMWLPEERARLIGELEKQGRVQNVEMTFRKKSGETGEQLVSVEMIELGGEKCILGLLTDITERKQAEEALLHSEQRFQTLATAAFEGIAISEQGRFIDANDQLAHLLGYEPGELIGLEVAAIIAPDDRDRVLVNIRKGIESKMDLEMVCKDGSRRFVEAHGQTIHMRGRQIRLTAIHDITERKRYEAELLHARQAAEDASRIKSQFLANMSHELRTPMTGILGMLQLALEEDLAPVPREYLQTTLSSARSLLRILNDILDMSRIEAGKLVMEEKPFSLQRCVTEAVEIITPELRRKGLDFALSVEDTPDTVIGDQVRLRQVLTNLIGNAVKFTGGGKVEVRITAGRTTSDGKREFTFAVTDTGIGIPADKKQVIFRAFSQVDNSHSRSFGGTGLGLVISKEIVELMGGTISFESEEGVGSTFSFTIPLAEAGPKRCDPLYPAESLSTGTTKTASEGERMAHLLLVEDDPTVRQAFGLMLQRANYRLDFAEDGLQAVEMWERGDYDLLLMDIQMPHLNGFEATRAIREKERARGGHTSIVAVTAHAYKEDEAMCLAAGMDAYISKPINFRKSLEVIGAIIKEKSRGV